MDPTCTGTSATATVDTRQGMAARTRRRPGEYAPPLILGRPGLAAPMVSPAFFPAPNLSNISRQIAGFGIMSMGMLLVVLTGGIDLSIGSVAAFSSVVTAM